jgi:hypothetical protein
MIIIFADNVEPNADLRLLAALFDKLKVDVGMPLPLLQIDLHESLLVVVTSNEENSKNRSVDP